MVSFFSGITWIGILYYFNFVQTPFFAETEASVRTGAIQKLVPRALWWFRWAAMVTFLAGLLMYLMRLGEMGAGLFFTSSYGVTITLGGLMGTIMFLNVWLVIWPNQQIVIASTNQVAREVKHCLRPRGRHDAALWHRGPTSSFLFRCSSLWALRVTTPRWSDHRPHSASSGFCR